MFPSWPRCCAALTTSGQSSLGMTLAVNSGLKSTSHSFTSLAYAKCKLFINIYDIEIKSTVSRYITVLFESLKLFIPWLEGLVETNKDVQFVRNWTKSLFDQMGKLASVSPTSTLKDSSQILKQSLAPVKLILLVTIERTFKVFWEPNGFSSNYV